ncbi:hypothetical protein HRbin17_02516 [bacterium HR17]|uniref:Uncharacterized protein n=1 Tax=Candidatus Fervidibacter japonicus TaxID=2035412 RepID=A0A2H5XFM4_9BACT|nr:hypothetical protein HRbin17_02516 [bacterium HR17]
MRRFIRPIFFGGSGEPPSERFFSFKALKCPHYLFHHYPLLLQRCGKG